MKKLVMVENLTKNHRRKQIIEKFWSRTNHYCRIILLRIHFTCREVELGRYCSEKSSFERIILVAGFVRFSSKFMKSNFGRFI